MTPAVAEERFRRIVAIAPDKDTRLVMCRVLEEEHDENSLSALSWLEDLEREVTSSPQSLDELRDQIREERAPEELFDALEERGERARRPADGWEAFHAEVVQERATAWVKERGWDVKWR